MKNEILAIKGTVGRVLVVAGVVGGILLVGMVGVVGKARREEPMEWMFVSEKGAFYRLSADGREMRKLADIDVVKIEFSLDRHVGIATGRAPVASDPDLFLVNFAGNRFRRLVDTPDADYFVGWIGGQDRFVFERFNWDGELLLYVGDGRDIRPLLPFETFDEGFKMWLPNDQGMIVEAHTGDGYDIFRVNADLSLRNLGDRSENDRVIGITPNGDWLLFRRGGASDGIYRMRLDGSHVERLTNTDGIDQFWTVSPDGEWMIFTTQFGTVWDGFNDIYRMRLDGSDVQRLTHDDNQERFHGLSGDGEWMMYSATLDDVYHLYRMRLDGSEQAYIVNLSYQDQVFWSPNREWLVYRVPDDTGNRSLLYSYDFGTHESVGLNFYRFETWSPDSEWLYFLVDDTGKRMLGRVRRDGSGREIMREVHDYFRIVGWMPIVEWEWDAHLLSIIGLAVIGGGFCGGYWLSRS